MIPQGPEHLRDPEPVLIPEIPIPARKPPFWDYVDLFFVISLCLPALFIAALLVKGLSRILPAGRPLQGLIGQLFAYVLIFGALYAVLHFRYRQPFWRSLGWKVQFVPTVACLLGGPPLALAIGWLGYILRAPVIETPFEEMLRDRTTLIVFAVFVVAIGPLCEELAFRGFMMPLLMRSFGALPGIMVTGALFGSLHGPEYSWSWQHVLLVSVAGMVFGLVRYKTGSTAAAVFLHSTYNLMQLAAFLIQTGTR